MLPISQLPAPKTSSVLEVSARSGTQRRKIILDFVTDNKYYFTGNNFFGAMRTMAARLPAGATTTDHRKVVNEHNDWTD